MFPEDPPEAADSPIHDALAAFTRNLQWLAPNPTKEPTTLEQMQSILAEWEPIAAEGRKLKNAEMASVFQEMDQAMDLFRARVAVWFRRDQMNLLHSFADYRLAEGYLTGARQLKEMVSKAAELQMEGISEMVSSNLGPGMNPNKLIGVALARTESKEETYEHWLKRMNTVWADEWEPALGQSLPSMSGETLRSWFERLERECEEIFQKHPQIRPDGHTSMTDNTLTQ